MTTKKRIQITYNPFVESNKTTIILPNGQEPDKKSKLANYKSLSLQSGINKFFEDLRDIYGSKEYSIEFTGLEVDCEDMREAVEQAKEKGFDIDYKENIIKPNTTERLKELEQLLDELKENPILKEHIKDNQTFAQLTDNTFDIFVVAPISAGKSSFINAMLGSDLLPNAHKATTAAITEIINDEDLDVGEYLISRENKDGVTIDDFQKMYANREEDKKKLSTWNSDADKQNDEAKRTNTIKIKGNLVGINLSNNKVKVKLSDTPGANNARNIEHQSRALNKIRDTNKLNPLIIYIFTPDNKETSDTDILLNNIAKQFETNGKMAEDRIIFLLNKADELFESDEQNSEDDTIEDAIQSIKDILSSEKFNITNPKVFPITSKFARRFRMKRYSQNLTEKQNKKIGNEIDEILENTESNLSQYMPLNERVIKKLGADSNRGDKLDKAIYYTGLPALEAYISDYIEKYNEPYRIIRLTKAINLLLEKAKLNLDTITELKGKKADELKELQSILDEAQNTLDKSDNIDSFIKDVQKREVALSGDVASFFEEQNKSIIKTIQEKGKSFEGQCPVDQAQKKLENAMAELKEKVDAFLLNFTSELSDKNEQQKNIILESLNNEYQEYVGQIFDQLLDDMDKSSLSIKENIKKLTVSINQYFKLDDKYISEQDVIIDKKEKERDWTGRLIDGIKGFFGIAIKKEYDYITEKQKFVNLKELWRDVYIPLDKKLSDLIRNEKDKIKENAEDLTKQYCSELNRLFKIKVYELLFTLTDRTKAEDLEKQIQDAEEKLELLREIETKLTSISSLEALEPQGE